MGLTRGLLDPKGTKKSHLCGCAVFSIHSLLGGLHSCCCCSQLSHGSDISSVQGSQEQLRLHLHQWHLGFSSDHAAWAKLQLLQGPFNTVTFMQSEPKCTWYSALVSCGLELLYSALRNISRRPLQGCFSAVTHSWLQLTCIHGRSEAQVLLQ